MTQSDFIFELKKINIDITDKELNQLEKYYELLIEWNEKINLTSITIKEEVYLKHFYDSITLSKAIDLNKTETLCDIGTGAGFPGIPLKIIFPNLKLVLIDALQKRINFLDIVIKELDLKDVTTIHARIEDFAVLNREKYDVVTARAVSNLRNLLEYTVPLVKVGGFFIAMKSNCDQELIDSKNAIKVLDLKEDVIKFNLPIENSNRTLIKFYKNKLTNKKYPRRYVEIKNRPL